MCACSGTAGIEATFDSGVLQEFLEGVGKALEERVSVGAAFAAR
jgi:hypothetical protein